MAVWNLKRPVWRRISREREEGLAVVLLRINKLDQPIGVELRVILPLRIPDLGVIFPVQRASLEESGCTEMAPGAVEQTEGSFEAGRGRTVLRCRAQVPLARHVRVIARF